MNKISHLLFSATGVGILSLILTVLNLQSAEAQRSRVAVPLGSTECVANNLKYETGEFNVSIARELFSAPLRAQTINRQDSVFTCRISSAQSPQPLETLHLKFGVPDGADYSYTVKVYLDGNMTASQVARPGELKTLLFDVVGINSVSIELEREFRYRQDLLYFVEASLEPAASLGMKPDVENSTSSPDENSRVLLEESTISPESLQYRIQEVEEEVEKKVNQFENLRDTFRRLRLF